MPFSLNHAILAFHHPNLFFCLIYPRYSLVTMPWIQLCKYILIHHLSLISPAPYLRSSVFLAQINKKTICSLSFSAPAPLSSSYYSQDSVCEYDQATPVFGCLPLCSGYNANITWYTNASLDYPDLVQHAYHFLVHTRNAEPLAVPNSMPLCLGLLPWNVPSVQLPLPSPLCALFLFSI